MKIVILQGSPNMKGSTNLLVESFSKGAKESGHSVKRLDIADMGISPCNGCIACGYEGPCAIDDDNEIVKSEILDSDMVVFATPLYYYGMSAQLKAVVDRFCSYNSSLHDKRLKSALLVAAWNSNSWTFEAIEAHYNVLVRYNHFDNKGMVLGYGCGTTSMTMNSKYIKDAYELGRSL